MRLLIIALLVVITVATNTTFYIESFGLISEMPQDCVVSCANQCLKCEMFAVQQCPDDLPFYELKKSGTIPLMVGLYSKSPAVACAGDYVMISQPGEYQVTVNVIHRIPQFIIYNTLISSFGNETIALTFSKGFVIP
jgi:hypothetical protein